MSHQSYIHKYELQELRRLSTSERLLSFFDSLNEVEWIHFFEDLAAQRASVFEILLPPRGEDLLSFSSAQLSKLGATSQRLSARALEQVISSHLVNGTRNLALDLFLLASSYRDAFSISFLGSVVHNTRNSEEIRVAAAKVLANQAESVPIAVWRRLEANILPELPGLAPFLLSGLSVQSPHQALEALARIQSMGETDALEYPLRITLRKILASEGGAQFLFDTLTNAPPWVRGIVERVLSFSEFSAARKAVGLKEQYEITKTTRELEQYLKGLSPRPLWLDSSSRSVASSVVRRSLEAMVEVWPILAKKDTDFSLRLIDILRNFPSKNAFAALGGILEKALISGLMKKDGITTPPVFLTHILEALAEMPTVARVIVASSTESDYFLWNSYIRCLRLALSFPTLADLALHQLVLQTSDREDIILSLRLALGQRHISANKCRSELMRVYPPVTCESILSKVVRLSHEAPPLGGEMPSGLLTVAEKLYSLNPDYLLPAESDEEDDGRVAEALIQVEDAALERFGYSFDAWQKGIQSQSQKRQEVGT